MAATGKLRGQLSSRQFVAYAELRADMEEFFELRRPFRGEATVGKTTNDVDVDGLYKGGKQG